MSRFPGTPAHHYRHEGDEHQMAEWLLDLVDHSPDGLAIMEIPRTDTDAELDDLEHVVSAAYDLAKEQRPDLSVKTMKPLNLSGVRLSRDVQLLLVIHEHEWVGGICIRGCGQGRDA